MTPGERIRIGREFKSGMTQKELARRSGLCQSHLSRIERDAIKPTPETLAKIARVLG